ncbi:MAG TPA: glycosyltransferase family 2 protein [Pyrinomonadaceae bacterium]|nr:glycosyltransferase family 2 protein [Pyrinomonadaceae bacterium]
MSKISIALCTYNGEKFLPAQLESYLAQTRVPDELVVSDDCSTDKTARIIEEFSRRVAFPVRFHRNEKNLRSTKNFERAISLCTGDLIFLSDQDDVWMPHKLARIEEEFSEHQKVGMVFSDAEIVDENLQPLGRNLWSFTFSDENRKDTSDGNFFNVLLSQNVVTGATMAFRAEYREIFMPIPEGIPNLIHDGWISLLIANETDVAFIDEPLIKYRQHAGQQLGIDYRAALENDFDKRRSRYDVSIEFGKKEIARLQQMKEIFAAFPQFEKWREKIEFADLIEEKQAKITHYEARRNLPRARTARLIPVFKEVLSGRYGRFSKGSLSATKDLLEKW